MRIYSTKFLFIFCLTQHTEYSDSWSLFLLLFGFKLIFNNTIFMAFYTGNWISNLLKLQILILILVNTKLLPQKFQFVFYIFYNIILQIRFMLIFTLLEFLFVMKETKLIFLNYLLIWSYFVTIIFLQVFTDLVNI